MKKDFFKFIIAWIVCVLLRIIPFRPPSVEPILATNMPFSKKYGAVVGFLFAFANIVLYDLITSQAGQWTFITATTYGIVGFGAAFFFRKFKNGILSYAIYAVVGTIFFDAVTGLSIGPLFFGQPFEEAFFGQIPFTVVHLLGNLILAITLSPVVEKWILKNPKLEFEFKFT